MLALAARLSTIAAEGEPPGTPVRLALGELLGAYAPEAPLASALLDARRVVRADKRAALALAWAREQVRLAVEDLLTREVKADRLRPSLPVEAIAWVVLVVAESLVNDLPGAAVDRGETLLALVGLAS